MARFFGSRYRREILNVSTQDIALYMSVFLSRRKRNDNCHSLFVHLITIIKRGMFVDTLCVMSPDKLAVTPNFRRCRYRPGNVRQAVMGSRSGHGQYTYTDVCWHVCLMQSTIFVDNTCDCNCIFEVRLKLVHIRKNALPFQVVDNNILTTKNTK